MRVIVEKPFSRYSVGEIIPEMPAGQARTLIARGMVREVGDGKAVEAPINRMMRRAPAVRKAG